MNIDSSCFLADEAATEAFGAELARLTSGKGLISLSGDLGAGKTTLCRGLLRAAGHQGRVKSPTYTLVEPYTLRDTHIMHFDLYRLEDPEELDFIGFRDYLTGDNLCLVEWPQKAGTLLPTVDLELELRIEGRGRRVYWQTHTPYGKTLTDNLNKAFKALPHT